jgi:hypothetical protein
VIDTDTGMPEHLRTALLSALGLVDAEIPALETVGLAVLGLLAGLATEATPLCVVVDDAHWLDASTASVLHFVARRLSADPIAALAAGRDGGWPPAGMLEQAGHRGREAREGRAERVRVAGRGPGLAHLPVRGEETDEVQHPGRA